MTSGSVETNELNIVSVSACTVSVPLSSSVSFATRQVTNRDYTLVKILTNDGVEGIGFCYDGNSNGDIVTIAVRDLLTPILLGQDPYRVEGIWQEMYQEAMLHGRAGSVMRAISAIDIALWDRNSRNAHLPLYKYLGAFHAHTVPAYASGGYYLKDKTPEILAQEVTDYTDMGFQAVKIKVGQLDPSGEEERVAEVRKAIGSDTLLMLDANNAWPDLPTALRYVRRFEKYDPYWIEEPFSPDDIENHARLAQHTPVQVATGEIEAGRWRHKALLEKGAATILQTDALACGGITEFRRIAAIASTYGITMAPHAFPDLHVHLAGATPNVSFVEYFPDVQILGFQQLIKSELQVCQGRLVLPSSPGLGFHFDEEYIARFSKLGWS